MIAAVFEDLDERVESIRRPTSVDEMLDMSTDAMLAPRAVVDRNDVMAERDADRERRRRGAARAVAAFCSCAPCKEARGGR